MSRRRTVSARPYTWDRNDPNAKPGVGLRGRNGRVFAHLTFSEARKLADSIHDICDTEQEASNATSS